MKIEKTKTHIKISLTQLEMDSLKVILREFKEEFLTSGGQHKIDEAWMGEVKLINAITKGCL